MGGGKPRIECKKLPDDPDLEIAAAPAGTSRPARPNFLKEVERVTQAGCNERNSSFASSTPPLPLLLFLLLLPPYNLLILLPFYPPLLLRIPLCLLKCLRAREGVPAVVVPNKPKAQPKARNFAFVRRLVRKSISKKKASFSRRGLKKKEKKENRKTKGKGKTKSSSKGKGKAKDKGNKGKGKGKEKQEKKPPPCLGLALGGSEGVKGKGKGRGRGRLKDLAIKGRGAGKGAEAAAASSAASGSAEMHDVKLVPCGSAMLGVINIDFNTGLIETPSARTEINWPWGEDGFDIECLKHYGILDLPEDGNLEFCLPLEALPVVKGKGTTVYTIVGTRRQRVTWDSRSDEKE